MNWKWFTNPETKHPYLACHPEEKPSKIPPGMNEEGLFGAWAAFTYQWTHSFIDFRNMEDKLGRNWFDNSRHAAVAARQYAIDRADQIKGLGPDSWGMSACMSPSTAYSGRYGSKPTWVGRPLLEDGTVPPYGSSAFVVFTPKESIEAIESMYTIPGLVGKYGLYDAYSFMTKAEGDKPWIGRSYLGIDKGLVALIFENYSTQLIWRLLHQNEHIQRGLQRLQFKHVVPSQRQTSPTTTFSYCTVLAAPRMMRRLPCELAGIGLSVIDHVPCSLASVCTF